MLASCSDALMLQGRRHANFKHVFRVWLQRQTRGVFLLLRLASFRCARSGRQQRDLKHVYRIWLQRQTIWSFLLTFGKASAHMEHDHSSSALLVPGYIVSTSFWVEIDVVLRAV